MHSRLLAASLLLLACSAPPSSSSSEVDGGAPPTTTTDGGSFGFGDAATPEAGPAGDGGECDPPDMMIVLDRSDSMKGTVCKTSGQHCSTAAQCCSGVCSSSQCVGSGDAGAAPEKWTLAVEAVDLVTQAPTDATMRFGLELLPDTAQSCGGGVVEVPLDLGNGATIASTLSTTQLEYGTPIGGALHVAATKLASVKVPNRKQYAILVTDGGETCSTDPPLPVVQALAAAGVDTFVVGFGGATNAASLNDLACAGMTAPNFSSSCTLSTGGYVASVPSTTHVFFDATDGAALKSALATITNGVCCGCNVPVN